jgi:hypothetical protein
MLIMSIIPINISVNLRSGEISMTLGQAMALRVSS